VPLLAIVIAAACSEKLDTSANCPVLCTDPSLEIRDTTLDVVTFDSAFAGFTGVGERWPAPALTSLSGLGFLNETFVAVANRADSLDVRQVFRFDTLPRILAAGDTTPITAVTTSQLLLVIDSVRSVLPATATTVALYDVDTTAANDTADATLTPLFRADRLIATKTFTPAQISADTIVGFGRASPYRQFTVNIPDSVMLNRITGSRRLRIGMRITSSSPAALRFVAPSTNSGGLVPRVSYDPSPDTAIRPWVAATQFNSTVTEPARFRAQVLVLRDLTPRLTDGTLQVGGLVGVRSLVRVALPRRFLQSITIVRASLDMTQRPLRTAPGATDRVRLRARVGIAGPALGTDPRRAVELLDPLLEGVQLASLAIAPADSGVRSFDVGDALRRWIVQDSTIPTSFILYSEGEIFQEQRPAFFSRRSPVAAVRPRVRLTYTTRREGAIP
jgi:hypothetical protein